MNTSKKRKILIVANVAKEHILKFHIPTIKKLKDEGWIVDVACSGKEKIPFCDQQFEMSYKRSPFTLKTFKGIKELKKIINKENYDIIYCHTPVGGLVARIAGKKARKNGTKVIYMSHGYHFYKGAPVINWILFYPVEKYLSRLTDIIITINKEDYEKTITKFKNNKTYIIDGIGMDTKKFENIDKHSIREEYRRKMNIPQDAIVLIYCAELIPNKNQKYLLNILKKLLEKKNNIYLILVGEDHTNGKFEKYAEKLNIKEKVRFLGWRKDIGELYATADICTASSIREGFGLNLVEAMTCGIPVIATKNRGHETIIVNGKNGFLVEKNDINNYEKSILNLIENKELKNQFIKEGLEQSKKYNSDVIVNQIFEILESSLMN